MVCPSNEEGNIMRKHSGLVDFRGGGYCRLKTDNHSCVSGKDGHAAASEGVAV